MESDCMEKNQNHNMCNGNKAFAVVDFKEEEEAVVEEEEEKEEDLETKSLLSSAVNGAAAAEEKRMRKVRFNDCRLTEVLEFQPSDSSDSEDDSRGGFSIWEDAIVFCAQLCSWLCGRRSRQ